jgi:hypothetical protein
MLARLASALLHSMALRARAGDSRSSLRAMAVAGVALICGEAPLAADARAVRPVRRRAK